MLVADILDGATDGQPRTKKTRPSSEAPQISPAAPAIHIADGEASWDAEAALLGHAGLFPGYSTNEAHDPKIVCNAMLLHA